MTARKKEKAKPGGRRRVVGVGQWLNRTQIAYRARMNRDTVTKYLAMDGAPKPNAQQCYNYAAVMAFIEKHAPRLSPGNDEGKTIRQAILKMEMEDREIDLKVKRGLYVPKDEIEPVIIGFMKQLTADLRLKFEDELPPKYEGKTTAERQKMNADAIDYVLARVRDGAQPLTA